MTRSELEQYFYRMADSGRITNTILIDGVRCEEDRQPAYSFVRRLMGTTDHPDVIYLEHEKPQLISADELRKQITENVVLKPYAKPYKIYFIEADLLNVQGQNILLKTLEEPPQYAVFLLFTKAAEMLLETVRSRCLILKLGEGEVSQDRNIELENMILELAAGFPWMSVAQAMSSSDKLIKLIEDEKATSDNIFDIINKLYRDALLLNEGQRMEALGNVVGAAPRGGIGFATERSAGAAPRDGMGFATGRDAGAAPRGGIEFATGRNVGAAIEGDGGATSRNDAGVDMVKTMVGNCEYGIRPTEQAVKLSKQSEAALLREIAAISECKKMIKAGVNKGMAFNEMIYKMRSHND